MTIEFSRELTQEDHEFLEANREELMRTDTTRAIWQNRVKKASETHLEVKALYTDPVTGEIDELFPSWPTFRDNFILDWINNRTIVTEEEADKMFERTAEEALAALESNESGSTESTTVVESGTVLTAADAGTTGDAPVAKKKAVAKKSKSKGVVKGKAKAAKKKAVAKRSAGGSKSAKAQVIVERFAARDWSRKDILAKLREQLDIGDAYAATLYQKFA